VDKMPYILKALRHELDIQGRLDELENYMQTLYIRHFVGALNFVIYRLVKAWLKRNGLSYFHISAILGTIDASKEELRRRVLNGYEDEKIKENGDV